MIPLSTDATLQDQYVSTTNGVRLGRILGDIDYFSAWLIFQYIVANNSDPNMPDKFVPFTFFTLMIDQVHFFADYVPQVGIIIIKNTKYICKGPLKPRPG